MSISPAGLPVEATRPPNPARVRSGTQFSWGRFSSRVSSMDTIFIWGGMNRRIAFSVVVFPEAVPPQMSIDCPFSIESHRGHHLGRHRLEPNQVERGEGVLSESPDRERGSSLRDVHAEGGLQTRAVRDRRVEHGLRDRDVLPGPLREPYDERIELLRVVELEVRRDGAVLAMVDIERHADAVARDVFDLNVRHDDVDRAVPDEVSIHVVEDAFLRHRMELDAQLPEEAVHDSPEVVLLPGAVRVVQHLEVLDEDFLEDIEDFRLLLDELRLDRLVEILVRHRVVQDPDIREVLQNRLDLDLVHVSLDDLRDRRDLAEARLLDAADLRRFDLDALVPEESGEVPLLDRVEGRGGAALLLLVHAVEHPLRFLAVGAPPVRVLRLRVVPLRGLGHSVTSDEQEREEGDHEHDEAVPQPVRDLPGVQDSGEDAIPEAVHDRRDEEGDSDLIDNPRKIFGQRALDGAARRGQRAARLEHLRQERHVEDPNRHQEDHEGNVNHRDVCRHRDSALVLGQLVLLRVMADHRQDVGDVASRIGGLDDDCDDPADHRGFYAIRKQAQRLRRGDAPRDLGGHLLDFRRELAVAASGRDDDCLGQRHAEPPGLRDIAEEVREPAFDLLDLPLELRHVEAVRPDEAEGRHHEPVKEALNVPLGGSEGEVHRVDQVQEGDEPEEDEQGRRDANDALAAVPLLGPPESGFLELDVRHLSPPVPCSR